MQRTTGDTDRVRVCVHVFVHETPTCGRRGGIIGGEFHNEMEVDSGIHAIHWFDVDVPFEDVLLERQCRHRTYAITLQLRQIFTQSMCCEFPFVLFGLIRLFWLQTNHRTMMHRK